MTADVDRSSAPSGARAAPVEEDAILEGLRNGDEQLFSELVRRWSGSMMRLALVHVESRAVAEEVVQESWLHVLRDLQRFEGRSALRTWVLGVVANVARSRARAERRSIPVASPDEPSIDAARFIPSDAASWPDHWSLGPVPWPAPEDALLAGETREVIVGAIAALPPAQREVIVLRDLEGLSTTETCTALNLRDAHERVLLHRARSRIRTALEEYFQATEPT